MLPAGDLRDTRTAAKRADIIIVTKCKPDLSSEEKNNIISEIRPLPHQTVFFTTISYGEPYHLYNKSIQRVDQNTDVLLVCGIANPKPLKDFLTVSVHTYDMLRYSDHHIFNIDEMEEIKEHYNKITSNNKMIITTEKDAVRLQKFETELKDFPLFALPIEHVFLFNEGNTFNEKVISFIHSFHS